MSDEQIPLKRQRGRPKKTELAAVKDRTKNKIGRPKGDAAIINDYKLRMLNSPKSAKVLEAIYDAALTDGHPGQTAAWKLIVDRIVPVSVFDTSKQSGQMPQISINISGLNDPKVNTVEEYTDVEVRDYDES
jgi:hypothetical protein